MVVEGWLFLLVSVRRLHRPGVSGRLVSVWVCGLWFGVVRWW